MLLFSGSMIISALEAPELRWVHIVSFFAFILSSIGLFSGLKPKENEKIEVMEISSSTSVEELFDADTEIFIKRGDTFSQIKKISK